ncbi:MAG: hypothetical protein ACD_24C00451G0002 [uncultured bacterium]|uniref:Protein-export membrane protein SecG n=1 Tax=Candidatus Curtissbacteria bacterium RIFOXYA1_FULL_41_14 TaxID=1797737 RepID=A0A1F5HBD8_9BACT|nr:MAG: hypothetical protein ACD_24C00451G0002 [uncultured bacterium]KKR60979.1 MAG: Preprotein translocase, SecG subunit [Candidatus Curtissbacteria bacterium GW2011_GWA2_40_31]KKR61831.1 MAG: Preprotein translocase, SecG subunit [Microgenomates group bacterium GW2011_GWC1_40_35]KKR74922.1 MAG: Preprotein translocase, SecG subunit [Candidatus Curtissbacteria bacterium GW2011_GWD1_40_8]KKS01618.1 MAG: Preprotein translocase, SecG subunit [Candidatus Curtissbacteria bacterium GW2011_GWC2_41_21]
MKIFLLVIQIAVSVALVIVILMQSKGSGIGTVFGGSDSFYRSKRGVEKLFLYLTVFLAAVFAITSIILVVI